jgi:hypothetical protein
MAEWCGRLGVAVWACCLMPYHVHMIAVPGAPDGLRRAVGAGSLSSVWCPSNSQASYGSHAHCVLSRARARAKIAA